MSLDRRFQNPVFDVSLRTESKTQLKTKTESRLKEYKLSALRELFHKANLAVLSIMFVILDGSRQTKSVASSRALMVKAAAVMPKTLLIQ